MKAQKGQGNKWPLEVTVGNATVKIYRNAEPTNASGVAFVLAWKTALGRKRQKFSSEADAITEARIKASQLNAGRIEGADMTRGDRDELQAARRLANGLPVLAALGEWAKASELTGGQIIAAAEAWKARNRPTVERITVSKLIDRFLAAKKRVGYNTERNHGSILEALRSAFGEMPLGSVSASPLTAYLSKIEHPSTRNTHRKRIVTLWRWAQSKNYLPRDTRTEAEQTDRSREEAPEVGIISPAVFGKLLEFVRAKHPADLAALVLAGFCGLRRGEIHGQTWEDISLAEKFVRVTTAKRGTPARRLVPLSDAAIDWLMLCPDRKGAVCDGLAIDRIRKAAIEAKFELPDNCLRHGYISHHVAAIGNVPQASLDAGNSPQIIHRHYRELATKAEGVAWFKINPAEAAEIVPIKKASN
jgi:integrase